MTPDDELNPDAVDLDALYASQDPRRISLESRRKMAEQTGLTLTEIDAFLAHMGEAWAEWEAEGRS